MLDAQRARVRRAADQRPRPAPDGAVVQLQVPQLLAVGVERLRQDHREGAHVLLEELEQRFARVAAAAADPADAAAAARGHAVQAHRLLEQRHPGLVPQVHAEQERRVAGDRHRRRLQRQRGVVGLDRLRLRHLQVDLERGAGGLQHHVLMQAVQAVAAADVDLQRAALAQLHHPLVERLVAVHAAHAVDRQVALLDGRQDADHAELEVHGLAHLGGVLPQRAELRVQGVEHAGADRHRVGVELDVEARQLRQAVRRVDALEVGLVVRQRVAVEVDQPGLQLEADLVLRVVEAAGGEAAPEPRGLVLERGAETPRVGLAEVRRADLIPHRRAPAA